MERLTGDDAIKAIQFYRFGRDTYDIASILRVDESRVYNTVLGTRRKKGT